MVSDAVPVKLYSAATPVTDVATLTPMVGFVIVWVLPLPVKVGVDATEPADL